jgi:hypothetical protein
VAVPDRSLAANAFDGPGLLGENAMRSRTDSSRAQIELKPHDQTWGGATHLFGVWANSCLVTIREPDTHEGQICSPREEKDGASARNRC